MTRRERKSPGELPLRGQVTPETTQRQAEMLENRLRAALRRWRPVFERQGIGAFRLYDRDIPEIRLVCDWYEGHCVVAELERWQTQAAPEWLLAMGEAAARGLGIPPENVHRKRRRTRPQRGPRYQRLADSGTSVVVREGPLRFLVRLDEHIDTGLFADHRQTRALVAGASADRDVLNLFGYTGSFTCAAGWGGAARTTTVDRSTAYLDWARENLELNGLDLERHRRVPADVADFLDEARREGREWDLVVCDPPSFSTVGGPRGSFDVDRDHPWLLARLLAVVRPGGTVFFSVNHQRFTPRLAGLPVQSLGEITHQTVPPDFRNRQVHRAFRIVR
jgi:23S rRNA (cytosine1962-C5)-methyltransferase